MCKGKIVAPCPTGIRTEGQPCCYLEYLLPQKLAIYLYFSQCLGIPYKKLEHSQLQLWFSPKEV